MTLPAIPANVLTLLARTGLLGLVPVPTARQWIASASSQPQISVPNGHLPKQLLVDVSVIHQHDAGTGIQRVVRSVLGHLQATPLAGYAVHAVAAEAKRPYHYTAESSGQGRQQVQAQKDDVFLGLDLAAHLLPRHIKQLLDWKLAGARLHFVVYDILPLTHPSHFKAKRVQHFRRWARLIASLADSLLCISRTVQADLQDWLEKNFGLSPAQLPTQVIALGGDFAKNIISTAPSVLVQKTLDQLQGQRWALMVGTLEPRKCHAQVLDAFEQLWQQNQPVCLVLIGRVGWQTEALQQRIALHPQLNRKLYWFNNASDSELELFYQQCTGVVAASLAEGYGLPLREAMAHGKPLLARNIPVFREVAGDYAHYFDDDTATVFGVKLHQWLHMPVATSKPDSDISTWANTTLRILQSLAINGSLK